MATSRASRLVGQLLAGLALAASAGGVATAAVPIPAPPHVLPGHLLATQRRGDEPPPPPDDRGCDILSYDLELRLDPAARMITGSVRVGFVALGSGLDTLRLDLVPDLAVGEIRRHGRDAPFVRRDEILAVTLDPPPAAGTPDTLIISWHGRPPAHGALYAGLMFREHDAGTPDDSDDDVPIIANVSQPWSAHAWWPCKDLPGDKALVSLAAVVPDTLTVVSNGTLLGVTQAGPGWRRWSWREAYPIAPYLVSVAATNYVGWAEDCRPAVGEAVPLEFAVFPQDTARAAHDLAPTCAMLGLLSELAGPWPFPGEKYAQAEIKWVGAMEHQTATSVSRLLLTGDGRYETFVVHELAHQWFGDALTPATWQDIWLNEGFARYCEALWIERTRGPQEYRAFMLSIGPRRHPDLFAGAGLLGDPDPILPNLLVYDKGAWLLHSLRLLVGDADFFRFLAAYASEGAARHGTVTTAVAVAAAERAVGRSLEDFFNFWLQTSAVAEITSEWTVAPSGAGSSRIALTLAQEQAPVVPVAVPVKIRTTRGTATRNAVLESRRQTFHWTVPGAVEAVAIDPDSLALVRHAPAPPLPLVVRGPAPNPVPAAGARFRITPAATGPVTVRVHDARGRLLDERHLGDVAAGEERTWDWLPVGADGSPLPSGVCWLVFLGPGGRTVREAVVLR